MPAFEAALKQIDLATAGATNKIDMYSGVGTIGIAIDGTKVLVESDEHNVRMAKANVGNRDIEVVHATSESAFDYITPVATIILDPPRAGLHANLTHKLLEARPLAVVYLSCNPATQARDVARLQEGYTIRKFEGYNFFPRTPHIESLVILEKK